MEEASIDHGSPTRPNKYKKIFEQLQQAIAKR